MSGRIKGGIAGWIAGTLPLAAVNVADIVGIFSFDEAVVAGAVALASGILLGGIVAGMIGGRPRDGRPGSASAAAPSGLVAAALFAVSVAALSVGSSIRDSAYNVGAVAIIRLVLTDIFFAALLVGVCLLTGAVVGRRAAGALRGPAISSSPARYREPSVPRPGMGMGPSRPLSRPVGSSRPVSHPVSRRPQTTDPRRADWQSDPHARLDDRCAPTARSSGQASRPARRPSGPSGTR